MNLYQRYAHFRIYANFFFYFFLPTKNSATDSQKSRYPPPTQPPTRHPIGRHSANMEATGTPRTAAHPGLLIQALIFSLYRVRRYSATQGTAHPYRRRCGSSWTTHPVRWIPHPGGSLIRWAIHPWTSWTRTGTPHPAHPVRWILDHPGTSWPAGHPGLSRWIPMDPDGSSSHGQGILMHPMGRASDGPMDIFVYTTSPLPHRFGPRLMGRGGLGVCVQIIQKGPSAFEVPPNS